MTDRLCRARGSMVALTRNIRGSEADPPPAEVNSSGAPSQLRFALFLSAPFMFPLLKNAHPVRALLIWLIAATLSFSQTAAAQSTACFALPTDEFSVKAAAELAKICRLNLDQSNQFRLVDAREILNKSAHDPRTNAIRKAKEFLKQGRDQYNNLELDAALEALGQALNEIRKAVGLMADGKTYVDVLLLIGASHILSGDSELGVEAFRKVALYNPNLKLDPKEYPTSMIEAYRAASTLVKGSPVGMVQLKSDPPAAEVYLNGVYKGITPFALADVPEGPHFVRLEKDGYLPWGKVITFFASNEERVNAKLETGPGLDQFIKRSKNLLGDWDDDPKAELIRFGQWFGLERLVLVAAKQRGSQISAESVLIQLEPPKKLAYKKASFNATASTYPARADALISSLYRKVQLSRITQSKEPTSGGAVVAGCNSDSDCAVGEVCDMVSASCIPDAPEKGKFYEKWWFWTIVGGSVAVVSGAGVLTWYLTKPDTGSIEFSF